MVLPLSIATVGGAVIQAMPDPNSSKAHRRMVTSILRARDLVKTVPTAEGELTILDRVSVEINAGESAAIVGESGSGKTTLLGLLAGLDLPTSGSVWLDGDEITAMSEEAGLDTALVNVIVKDGVVQFWGLVGSSAEKRAAQVAAENAPGVISIENDLGQAPAGVSAY